MSKFLFISVTSSPIGQRILQERLRQRGISTEILDLSKPTGDKTELDRHDLGRMPRAEAESAIRRRLLAFGPQLDKARYVGLTFFDAPQVEVDPSLVARILRETHPDKTIIGGGPGMRSSPAGHFRKANLDYALIGEADEALPELVESLDKSASVEHMDGLVRRRGRRVLLPEKPAKASPELIRGSPFVYSEEDDETVGVLTLRGCPFACVYCTVLRKGSPVPVEMDTVLNGLRSLARKRAVRRIRIWDGQFFAHRRRATLFLNRVIEEGLNKRFSFISDATIDSLKRRDGKPDEDLIKLVKKANFVSLWIGLEAMDDNILRELKSNPQGRMRYTTPEAVRVLQALAANMVHSRYYLLAGGLDTKPADFFNSYRCFLALFGRRRYAAGRIQPEFWPLAVVSAYRGTPIYSRALQGNSLVGRNGTPIKKDQDRVGVRYVVPKDPLLRDLFIKRIRKASRGGKVPSFGADEGADVLRLAKQLADQDAGVRGLYLKMKKEHGRIAIVEEQVSALHRSVWKNLLNAELKRQHLPETRGQRKSLAARAPELAQDLKTRSRRIAERFISDMDLLDNKDTSRFTEEEKRAHSRFRLTKIRYMRQETGIGWTMPA
ncbi:MAG: radical SAM protein [Deltaproteobacteria bacterium]|nr:radical SAM protein [Deltaproteobacteria bacterium]